MCLNKFAKKAIQNFVYYLYVVYDDTNEDDFILN